MGCPAIMWSCVIYLDRLLGSVSMTLSAGCANIDDGFLRLFDPALYLRLLRGVSLANGIEGRCAALGLLGSFGGLGVYHGSAVVLPSGLARAGIYETVTWDLLRKGR
jgi:hypothetical protein